MCNPESAAYKLTVISNDFEHFDSSPLDRLQWDHKADIFKILGAHDTREDGFAGLPDHATERLTPGPLLPGAP